MIITTKAHPYDSLAGEDLQRAIGRDMTYAVAALVVIALVLVADSVYAFLWLNDIIG